MKEAVVIVVLAVAGLAVSHPYYHSSYKPNGNSVDMQSGKDLTRRPLVSWQEYAEGLVQGKKPPPPGETPTESPCKSIEMYT